MRLDLVLKQSGLIKRRTIAKAFCDKGLVEMNGRKAKPSYEVKDGDVMEITFGTRVITVAVTFEILGKKTIIHLEEIGSNKVGEADA